MISVSEKEYDYIILDSPPLGLVADALELTKFVDATIYMVRQNYTKKGMFSIINYKCFMLNDICTNHYFLQVTKYSFDRPLSRES